MYYTFADYN